MPNDNYPEAVRAIAEKIVRQRFEDRPKTLGDCEDLAASAIADGTRSLVWELNAAAAGMCLYYCLRNEPHTPACVRRRALLSKWSEEEK